MERKDIPMEVIAIISAFLVLLVASVESGFDEISLIRALAQHKEATHIRIFVDSSHQKGIFVSLIKEDQEYVSVIDLGLTTNAAKGQCHIPNRNYLETKVFLELNVIYGYPTTALSSCVNSGLWLLINCRENCTENVQNYLNLDSEVFHVENNVIWEIYKLPVRKRS